MIACFDGKAFDCIDIQAIYIKYSEAKHIKDHTIIRQTPPIVSSKLGSDVKSLIATFATYVLAMIYASNSIIKTTRAILFAFTCLLGACPRIDEYKS